MQQQYNVTIASNPLMGPHAGKTYRGFRKIGPADYNGVYVGCYQGSVGNYEEIFSRSDIEIIQEVTVH